MTNVDTRHRAEWSRKLAQSILLKFPCTLRDMVLDHEAPLFHVYTEYRGLRYYVASEASWRNANQRTQEYRIAYPRAMTFIRDRADSTQIDGTWQELREVYHKFAGR